MREYYVRWSFESIYDVADIADYIEREFGEDRAEKFNNDIDVEGGKLSYTYRGFRDTGIYYRGLLIRMKVFSPSIIFYVVDDTDEQILILRVLRHERDWQRELREKIFYTFD